ncbi:hypothetical protein [Lutibacter sp. B1]|uniref:hypothetical protein n=1 Tax=Lutibacter sp. B1 TaxID=2725996 RepID=UPI00145635FF|nr:hypothetical protein [Lutibacter sp. B1]NLP57414.1 hypothetical protein [Lutibacter sp. B1]
MDAYKNQSFLKLTIRFGFMFLVVVTILKIVISTVKNGGISGMTDEYFGVNTWQQFVKIQLVISAIYGAFMAGYYKFIKK